MIEEKLADVCEVLPIRIAWDIATRRSDPRLGPAEVVGAATAGDRPLTLEPIGEPRQTRRQQPGSPLYVAFADARRRQMPLRAARLRELLAAS